jgi:hypothetical protein
MSPSGRLVEHPTVDYILDKYGSKAFSSKPITKLTGGSPNRRASGAVRDNSLVIGGRMGPPPMTMSSCRAGVPRARVSRLPRLMGVNGVGFQTLRRQRHEAADKNSVLRLPRFTTRRTTMGVRCLSIAARAPRCGSTATRARRTCRRGQHGARRWGYGDELATSSARLCAAPLRLLHAALWRRAHRPDVP